MASTPEPIEVAIGVTATDLYTAFTGGASRAWLVSLDLTNTTTSDITVDVYKEVSGPTDYRFGDDLIVPAKGTLSWRGMLTLKTAGDKIKAIASATGVDCVGTVVENA